MSELTRLTGAVAGGSYNGKMMFEARYKSKPSWTSWTQDEAKSSENKVDEIRPCICC